MAIPTFGAAGTLLAAGSRATSNVPIPAGVTTGSTILVALYSEDLTTAPTPPSGFTQVPDSPIICTATFRMYVWEKRQTSATGAGETTGNYAFTHPTTATYGAAFRFEGCVTSGSVIDTACGAGNPASVTGTPPVSVYTTGTDRLLVWIGTNFDSTRTYSTITGYTERLDNSIACDTKDQAAAGFSGVPVSTMSAAIENSAWLGALIPAGGTSSPTITVRSTASKVVTASRSPNVTFPGTYIPATNDVVVFFVAATVTAATATAPSGWVLPTPASGTNPVTSDSHTQLAAYHLVTSAEATAATLTYTATNLWDVAKTGNVVAVALRGVNPASVVDSLVSAFDSANTATPHVLPALTGADLSTGSVVVSAVAAQGTGTYTTPTGYTLWSYFGTNQGQAVYTRDALTAASTNVAATNITPSAGDEYCAFTFAFSNSAVGGSTGAGTLTSTATVTGAGTTSSNGTSAAAAAITGAGVLGVTSSGSLTVTVAATGTGSAGGGAVTSAGAITAAATITGTGSTAAAGTQTTTATITGAGTLGRVGAGTQSAAAAITGSGLTAATGAGTTTATATITGAGVVGVTGTGSRTATATITGAGTTAGAGTLATTATITGSGVLATTGAGSLTVTATIAGSAGTLILGTGTRPVTATIAGAGTAAVTGTGTRTATATITGAGVAAATGTGTSTTAAAITGSGVVGVTGSGARVVTATITGSSGVGLSGSGTRTVTATITGAGALGAPAVGGTLTAVTVITGSGIVGRKGSGSLLVVASITGSAGGPPIPQAGRIASVWAENRTAAAVAESRTTAVWLRNIEATTSAEKRVVAVNCENREALIMSGEQ